MTFKKPLIDVNTLTVGSDFELMGWNGSGVESCIGKIGGTKQDPLSIGKDCFRQEDNVMAEFNIPPVNNVNDWLFYINYCQKKGNEVLSKHGLTLLANSAAYYSEKELNHPKAQQFGCSTTYSAYTGDHMEKPCGELTNLRTCGFHIHNGFKLDRDAFSMDEAFRLVKYQDLYLWQ